jgi:hypothetical protein
MTCPDVVTHGVLIPVLESNGGVSLNGPHGPALFAARLFGSFKDKHKA